MNEKEKEAIKVLNNFSPVDCGIEDVQAIETILNLIEKQQKEIEELSIIKNSIQTLETHFVNDDTYYVIAKENFLEGDFRHILDDYISKDKIKDLIAEIEKIKKLADEQIKDRRIIFAESESLNLGYSVAHGKDIDLLKELLGD